MNKKVCGERPPYSQAGKSYPTCGLTCAGILANRQNRPSTSSLAGGQNNGGYAAGLTLSGSSCGIGRAPITSNASPTSRNLSRARTATAQSFQNNTTPLTRSRSQHFNATAPPITRSHSRHFNTPPPQYTLSSLGREPLQSRGHTPQRSANQYTPPSGTPLQRSGSGGQVVQRNPSQGGTVSQTYSRRSRYFALPSNPLPCVVSAPRSLCLFY